MIVWYATTHVTDAPCARNASASVVSASDETGSRTRDPASGVNTCASAALENSSGMTSTSSPSTSRAAAAVAGPTAARRRPCKIVSSNPNSASRRETAHAAFALVSASQSNSPRLCRT